MGKVGSTTLQKTLIKYYPGYVVHAHNVRQMTKKDKLLFKLSRFIKWPVLYISPVREPLSRNVSAFFENYERDTGMKPLEKKLSISEITDLFLTKYNHSIFTHWHDKQLEIISDFIKFKLPKLEVVHLSSEKDYGSLYSEFKGKAVLPESYMKEMCESKMCKHFWTNDEMNYYKNKWTLDGRNKKDVSSL